MLDILAVLTLKCTSSATQADPCDNERCCASPPIHQLRIARKHPVNLTNPLIHTENWGRLGTEYGIGLIIYCEIRSLTSSLKGTEVSVDAPDSHLVQQRQSKSRQSSQVRGTALAIHKNQLQFTRTQHQCQSGSPLIATNHR